MKLNYMLQIKGYWVLHDLHSLGLEEVGLYFHLLEISNKLNWMNPFKRNNSKVMADLGIKDRRTLDRYRNSLKMAGAIDFKTKNGDSNTTYTINDLSNYCTGNGIGGSIGNSIGYSTGSGIGNGIDKINQTKTQTKQRNSATNVAGADEKKEAAEAATAEVKTLWQKIVDTWFDFYEAKIGAKPTFTGQSPKSLKKIIDLLQRRSVERQIAWTDDVAVDTFKKFLEYAYSLTWIKDNFLLQNLERQFDKIANQHGTGTRTGTAAGNPGGNALSAFSKIDGMSD